MCTRVHLKIAKYAFKFFYILVTKNIKTNLIVTKKYTIIFNKSKQYHNVCFLKNLGLKSNVQIYVI